MLGLPKDRWQRFKESIAVYAVILGIVYVLGTLLYWGIQKKQVTLRLFLTAQVTMTVVMAVLYCGTVMFEWIELYLSRRRKDTHIAQSSTSRPDVASDPTKKR